MRSTEFSSQMDYVKRLYAEETPALKCAYAMGEKLRPGMQISAVEGKMLYVMAKMIGARNILELGTFMGYSTLWLAAALPEGGHVTTVEYEPVHAHLAREHFALSNFADRIEVREGEALEILAVYRPAQPLDLIFMDAEKRHYPNYLELTLPHLRRGGLVIADNTFLFGNVYREFNKETSSREAWEAMRRFNETLADPARFDSLLFPTQEGLTVAMKN